MTHGSSVRMGPVASLSQRREVLEQLVKLEREAQLICGGAGAARPLGADADRGAFLAPTLLYCREPAAAGRCIRWRRSARCARSCPTRQLPRRSRWPVAVAAALPPRSSRADDALAAQLVRGLAPYHGRIVVVNRHSAKESTGHGSPLPHLVHGGPGRAGGGEEMGGIRGLMHYMQRTAVQGSPDVITR